MPDFDPLTRPSFDEWGLGIAAAVATRGECTRRRIGAVIVNQRKRQIWAGYNGAPPGELSCLQGACPRGRHYLIPRSQRLDASTAAQCACGNGWPCHLAVLPDSAYDTGDGACIATHAELNCLLDAGRARLDENCVMYVSDQPCPGCLKIAAGYISRIVWPGGEVSCGAKA